MSNDDASEDATVNTEDPYIPTIPNGTKIIFDGNPATIDGVLHSISEHYESNNIFQPFLKHNMVVLSNGRLAVDSISAVSFLSTTVSDIRTLKDPCPPTPQRMSIESTFRKPRIESFWM